MKSNAIDDVQKDIGGSALRRARQHIGLSQRELARRAHIAPTTVRELEQRPRFGRALERLTLTLTAAGYMDGGPLEQQLERRLLELEERVDAMDMLLFGSLSDCSTSDEQQETA